MFTRNKKLKAALAVVFHLAAGMLVSTRLGIIEADFTPPGGASAAVGAVSGGAGGDGGDSGNDDARRQRVKEFSERGRHVVLADGDTNKLFKMIEEDTTERGELLKICHEQLCSLKNNVEQAGKVQMQVFTAYDQKNDRYRITLKTEESVEGHGPNEDLHRYFETMIWFNKDGSITQEHHANSAADLGYWDSPYFRKWSGTHKTYNYSEEKHGHRYNQLNMALASTAIWMKANSKCQVQNPVLQDALNDLEQDAKFCIDNVFEALSEGVLKYSEKFIKGEMVKVLEGIFPRVRALGLGYSV